MARPKKDEVNKTQKILELSKSNRNAGPKAIAEALKKEGIHVTPGYVSTIRSKHGVSKRRRKRGATPTATTVGVRGRKSAIMFENLADAKKFVQSVGDVAQAKRVLEAYASLQ